MTTPAPPTGLASRLLALIERAGNALPHPATLFALMSVLVAVVSAAAAQFDLSVVHPGSTTNIISPMMNYIALIVAFMQRYDPRAGIGTIIATMLPYSASFLVVWTTLLILWVLAGLPLGRGAQLFVEPARP
jgi:p-aminobenzoyl-glutamate transporter AbgT